MRFTEVFQFDPLLEYHRVILAEEFMEKLAPTYWPPEKRVGYCVHIPYSDYECTLKDGNVSSISVCLCVFVCAYIHSYSRCF